MYKQVNDKRVKLSAEEEKQIKDEWAAEEQRKLDYIANERYRDDRAKEYPYIGDQLDALMKQFAYMRLNGVDLAEDLDRVLGEVLAVKRKHPKPEAKK
jgi:hypothetical protein